MSERHEGKVLQVLDLPQDQVTAVLADWGMNAISPSIEVESPAITGEEDCKRAVGLWCICEFISCWRACTEGRLERQPPLNLFFGISHALGCSTQLCYNTGK